MPPSTARSDSSLCGRVFCCGRVSIMPRTSAPLEAKAAVILPHPSAGAQGTRERRKRLVAGIERRRRLVDDLDLVAVGIEAEDVRFAGAELALAADRAAGPLHGARRLLDVRGVGQPEAEVEDAAALAGLLQVRLEDQDVPAARGLHLDEVGVAVDRLHAGDLLVEAQRPLGIADGERHVRHAVGLEHRVLLVLASDSTARALGNRGLAGPRW